jgi:hypothetical protein
MFNCCNFQVQPLWFSSLTPTFHSCKIHRIIIHVNILISSIHSEIVDKSSMIGVTRGAGTDYTFRAHEFTSGFGGIRVAQSLVFCVVFCWPLFLFLYFFFWPLDCLSFDLHLLTTPLLSSNFPYIFPMDAYVKQHIKIVDSLFCQSM